jgi:hypothetical protein
VQRAVLGGWRGWCEERLWRHGVRRQALFRSRRLRQSRVWRAWMQMAASQQVRGLQRPSAVFHDENRSSD